MNMYEYKVNNKHCGMSTHIFGYSFANACKRAGFDPNLWEVEYQEYVD
jgi:hypothetical protein